MSPAHDPKADIARVRRESETLGSSAMARAARRAGDDFAAADAPEDDAIERWGRRIGRGLSVVAFVALGWYVGSLLRFW